MKLSQPHRLSAACALLIGLSSLSAVADEAALYGPSAPKGSAFVRLFNAGSQEVTGSLGNTELGDVRPLASSDFSYLSPGSYNAQVDGASLPVKLDPDSYYTLVAVPGGKLELVEEDAFNNRQKALVRVHNLSDAKVALKTADGKTEVIPAVAPGGDGDREINPVKVDLALYDGSSKVSDLKPVVLQRGEVTALYVLGKQGSLTPTWVVRPARTE